MARINDFKPFGSAMTKITKRQIHKSHEIYLSLYQNVRKRDYFTKYGEQARAVLEALLDKYADQGIENIESRDVLRIQPLSNLGTPVELVKAFGSREEYVAAVRELEE